MSQVYIQIDKGIPVACDNCGWTGLSQDLEMITDIEERLTPGGVVPAGECPNDKCGALAYIQEGLAYLKEKRERGELSFPTREENAAELSEQDRKEELKQAIVEQVEYWDLETLIGWVKDEIYKSLADLSEERLQEELKMMRGDDE